MRTRFSRLCMILALVGTAGAASADWRLDPEGSALHYVTSKASAVSEVNTFRRLDGAISDQGKARLEIDLTSVDTNIEIRDQRMQEIVFEVSDYPTAQVSVDVDTAALASMEPGSTMLNNYDATVSVHGTEQTLSAALRVIKLDGDTVVVQTVTPLLVSAGSFGLAEAVEELREVAGLPSINPTIVVTFSLVYHRQ